LRRFIGHTFIALHTEFNGLTWINLVIPTHTRRGKGIVAGDVGIPTTGAGGAIGVAPIHRPIINWRAGIVGDAHCSDKTAVPFALDNIVAAGCVACCGMH
jgi:hypothetical protein